MHPLTVEWNSKVYTMSVLKIRGTHYVISNITSKQKLEIYIHTTIRITLDNIDIIN
jgi:hypothetical protein